MRCDQENYKRKWISSPVFLFALSLVNPFPSTSSLTCDLVSLFRIMLGRLGRNGPGKEGGRAKALDELLHAI